VALTSVQTEAIITGTVQIALKEGSNEQTLVKHSAVKKLLTSWGA
jgi:hypothetical protein